MKSLYRAAYPFVVIDKNLARPELTDAERSRQLCRRKEIYETLHPETAQGSAQAAGMNRAIGRGRQNGDDVQRFTKATAAATGQSERVIQRAVARGKAFTAARRPAAARSDRRAAGGRGEEEGDALKGDLSLTLLARSVDKAASFQPIEVDDRGYRLLSRKLRCEA